VTNPAAFVDPVDDAELDGVVLGLLDSDDEDEVEEVLELVLVMVLCVTLATVLVAPIAAVAVAREETVTSASFVTVITA
jgi:hypothetical protein